ncbi:MAG: LuxR C-terminal-related transcriptional regulator [Nocardioides sp.]
MTLELPGLGAATQAVYRLLLADPDTDLESLQRRLHLTADQALSALGELAELALVRWDADDPAARLLVDPDVALSALIARQEAEIAERQFQVEQSRQAVAQLLASRASTDPGQDCEGLERLVTHEEVSGRLDQMIGQARQEVWSINPKGPGARLSLARSRTESLAALGRGVRMRAIYLEGVREDAAAMGDVESLLAAGCEVRTTTSLPLRMLVLDRQRALVPLDEHHAGEGALVVTGHAVVSALVALFVSTWKSADRVTGGRQPGRPSDQERGALRMWAQGLSDRAVGEALGVSERTVRRIHDSLAERLGARSRFELGARAVDVGWVAPADLV